MPKTEHRVFYQGDKKKWICCKFKSMSDALMALYRIQQKYPNHAAIVQYRDDTSTWRMAG